MGISYHYEGDLPKADVEPNQAFIIDGDAVDRIVLMTSLMEKALLEIATGEAKDPQAVAEAAIKDLDALRDATLEQE